MIWSASRMGAGAPPPPAGWLALVLLAGCPVPLSEIDKAVADADASRIMREAIADSRPEDFCSYQTQGRFGGDVSASQSFDGGRVVRAVHEFRGDRVELTWDYEELDDGSLRTTVVEERSGRSENRTQITITVEDDQGRPLQERVDRQDDGEFERETTWRYDGLITRTEARTPPDTFIVTTARHDEFGNVVEEILEYEDGLTLSRYWTYDEQGDKLLEYVDDSSQQLWTYNERDFEASFEARSSAGPRLRQWSFDGRGLPIQVFDEGPENLVFWDARFEYDDRGQRILEEGTRYASASGGAGFVDALRRYAYDEGDRLIRERIEASDGAWTATLQWTDDGRLLSYRASNDDGSDQFEHALAYDDQGRLVTHWERQRDEQWVGSWTYDCR